MADQFRKDQSGGNQATGKNMMQSDVVQTKTTEFQTDNWTGKGTEVTPLKRVPGTKGQN